MSSDIVGIAEKCMDEPILYLPRRGVSGIVFKIGPPSLRSIASSLTTIADSLLGTWCACAAIDMQDAEGRIFVQSTMAVENLEC